MVLELKVRGQGWAILGEEFLCQQGGAVQFCSGPSRHRHRRPCPSARKTGKDRNLCVLPCRPKMCCSLSCPVLLDYNSRHCIEFLKLLYIWRRERHPTGNAGSSPEWGRPPEVGNGNPLQCSCLENPMGRGTTIHRVAKSRT